MPQATREQLQAQLAEIRSKRQPMATPPTQQTQGNVSRFIDDFKNTLFKHANKGVSQLETGLVSNSFGQQVQAGANLAGTVAGGAADLVFGTPLRAAFHALPQGAQSTIKSGVGSVLGAARVPQAMQAYEGFKQNNPQIAQNIENVANIASVLPGAAIVGKGVNKSFTKLGEVGKDAGLALKEGGVNRVINRRVNELTKLESRNSSLRKVIQTNSEKGIDVKKIVSETDLLKDAVDKSGAIRTTQEGGAVSQLQEFIKPQEKVISKVLKREGKSIALPYVESYLKDIVRKSGLEGGALTRGLKNVEDDIAGYRLKADATDAVPLDLIQDAKIDKYRNVNYLNPESKRVDKAIAKGLKEIVENNTSSADVKALNQELSRHYAVLDFLEKLDGKIVAGGKLGKYFASTIGSIVGSKFGPLGAIAGAEIGGAIKSMSMASKFRGSTGKALRQSEAMKRALK